MVCSMEFVSEYTLRYPKTWLGKKCYPLLGKKKTIFNPNPSQVKKMNPETHQIFMSPTWELLGILNDCSLRLSPLLKLPE